MLNTWIVFILLYEKALFYYILTIELLMKYKNFLTVVYIVTNVAFKTAKLLWKIWKYKINKFYQTNLKAERKACIISFYSKDISTFNELIIKILLLKDKTIFAFIEGFHMPHRQSSLIEGRIVHYKVSFPLNFTSLRKILQKQSSVGIL